MANRICSVEGCHGKHQARSYCFKHWKKWRKYGDPLAGYSPPTVGQYIEANTARVGGCLEWTGAFLSNGYGSVGIRSFDQSLAHRLAYEEYVGPIPDGLQIDHLCRNRACVEPSHLEVVTQQENMRRGLQSRLINGMDDKCLYGHPYTPENTYRNPNRPSHRSCRECSRIRGAARVGNRNNRKQDA